MSKEKILEQIHKNCLNIFKNEQISMIFIKLKPRKMGNRRRTHILRIDQIYTKKNFCFKSDSTLIINKLKDGTNDYYRIFKQVKYNLYLLHSGPANFLFF